MSIHENNTRQQAESIVMGLAHSTYKSNYQPTYADPGHLTDALSQIIDTVAPVTTPAYIDELSRNLADIVETSNRSVVITGNCSERVDPTGDASRAIQNSLSGLALAQTSSLGSALHIRRERGQNTKPRSEEFEYLPDGRKVVSYMGDAVNGQDIDDREPNPDRLVLAARQAAATEAGIIASLGIHIPSAHEALNLYYEQCFMRQDPRTGKTYLLSTDMPWVGVRTNQPDSDQVELLSGVENPVGVKLGPGTTAEHIEALVQKLNPQRKLGKLAFMVRYGHQHSGELPEVLQAIRQHAPESLIEYDIHGSTEKRPDGTKIRSVEMIQHEIQELALACNDAGLVLHGIHLETTTDASRLECIDGQHTVPLDEGGIDPQLNPRQTLLVLGRAARILSAQHVAALQH